MWRQPTKALLVAISIAFASLLLVACSGTQHGRPTTLAHASTVQALRGDDDDDDVASAAARTTIDPSDHDFDNDSRGEDRTFYDADDSATLSYGAAPGGVATGQLRSLVERYYAAAAVADGARACSLLTATWVRAVPEDYGRGAGPRYARGDTCARVMALLFEHAHAQLADGVVVKAMRVAGTRAQVVVGSKSIPASVLTLERRGRFWRVADPFATVLQ